VLERIGTSSSGQPLVLADLDPVEEEALTRLLDLAETHLGEIKYPALRSRCAMAETLIADLRARFGLRANRHRRRRTRRDRARAGLLLQELPLERQPRGAPVNGPRPEGIPVTLFGDPRPAPAAAPAAPASGKPEWKKVTGGRRPRCTVCLSALAAGIRKHMADSAYWQRTSPDGVLLLCPAHADPIKAADEKETRPAMTATEILARYDNATRRVIEAEAVASYAGDIATAALAYDKYRAYAETLTTRERADEGQEARDANDRLLYHAIRTVQSQHGETEDGERR
jgi:hypothetical protein